MSDILNRVRKLNDLGQKGGPVIYWMNREQRVKDNWALYYAQNKAVEMKVSLIVVFCMNEEFFGTRKKHYDFSLLGLEKVYLKLKELNIPFVILEGDPIEKISSFVSNLKGGCLITDFSPLKSVKLWNKTIGERIDVEFEEVDAHNIVPCLYASGKQEYAAYTLRPKIHKKLDEFLYDLPKVKIHPFTDCSITDNLSKFLLATQNMFIKNLNKSRTIKSGEDVASFELKDFIDNRLSIYHDRNDPNRGACSGLSPYLNFGQISAQRVASEVLKHMDNAQEFIEELIVRRELSDNFCYYNLNYDNTKGFPKWAKETLENHKNDPREFLYNLDQLESASTHDDLWNAAQMEMVKNATMHGYLRMYWAKKILEWSETVEMAMENAIFLNDKYQLDGMDPNGYTGIAWSIGGVHDRAWAQRPIFGKVRYMAYSGCKRKFDIKAYIDRVNKM